MKKLSAILFLFVLLFNLQGYHLLINYLQVQEDGVLDTQLSKNEINSQELVTLKVPVSLPYYTNSASYEHTNGEVNIKGTIYKYVKKRIYNDSIEFVCVQHIGKMRLENARDEFFKLCNDLQTASENSKKSPAPQVKPLAFEYFESFTDITVNRPVVYRQNFFKTLSSFYNFTQYTCIDQPPEKVA